MVTTGGGGAILTNNAELAAKAKHLTTTAKTPHLWEYRHDQIGYNYRMPNLNAALGCAQLEKAPHILKSKRKLFEMYEKVMADIDEVKMFQQPQNCRSNYWLQVLLINKKNQKYKTAVLEKLQREKILARPAWGPLHQQIPYRKSPKMDLETTESICNRLINLPSSAFLAPCNKS
jgi:perosamine synthetase